MDRWTEQFVAWSSFGGVIFLCATFVIICWSESRPGARRTSGVGIRLPATKASDEAWVAGHAAALPLAKYCAIVLAPLSVVMMCFVGLVPQVVMVVESVLVAVSLAWLLVATAVASRAATAVASQP
ncbi:MAG: SdpI family protein [Propionibacteriaceae bacterium]|jgi:hypothetical protein|nr:SdpI family protein [Propionibacteriaceae bacterium]